MRIPRILVVSLAVTWIALALSRNVSPLHSAPSPVAARKQDPTIRCQPAVIEADEEFTWHLSLTLSNPSAVPLIAEGGRAVIEDLGEGETRDARTNEQPLPHLVEDVGTLEPGRSRTIGWDAPATIEHGRVSIEIEMHDSSGTSHHLTASAGIEPGRYSKQHPSDLVLVGGRKVEMVFVAPADSSALPAPGVLLVHGHAHHARQMLRRARALSRAGFAVMLVSQPGYGLSEGPADFMGPRTIAAASAALDRLARSSGVDSTRLGAWGFSRGATVVTLLMTRRDDVRSGVAQAGIFDMWAGYRGTRFDGIRANMVAETGPDSSAWRERSAAYSARTLKGRLLILHGEDDENVPVTQAKAFYAQLKALGAGVEAQFFPVAAHALPQDQASGRAMDFLRRTLAVAGSEIPIKAASYASATEALRDLDRDGPALTSQAAMWLMRGANLDWPVDSTGFHRNPWVVAAIPTRNLRYCVLAGARRGEFGPFGEARYALVDSAGQLQWTMTGKLNAWPAIADNGTVALIWVAGHAPSGWRPDSLNVEFISVSGQVIGSKAWGNRTRRPVQRGALADVYGFAPVSNQFFATVNQSNDDSVESDSDTLYAVAPDGRILWSRGLGAMRTNELWFSTNGDRVAATDLLQASVGYNNRVFVFDSTGRIIARQAIPGAIGADGSVLDPTTDKLYAYSFDDGIVALSLRSGRFQHRQGVDVVKKLQGFDDKRTAVRAARLVQRVEIEKNRRAKSR